MSDSDAPKPPAFGSVTDMYAQAYKEIERRVEAAKVEGRIDCADSYFPMSDEPCGVPYAVPGQDWALVTFGTAVLAPRPVDPTRPAMRVYGAFATREEAREHAATVQAVDDSCSIIAVRMREWILMPQTEAARDDPQEATRIRDAHLAARQKSIEANRADFHDMVEAKSFREARPVECPDPELEEAEALVYKPPRKMRSGAEVRGQSVVVMCVQRDSAGGECLVNVLGCFESTSDAECWVRDVASRTVTSEDILTAPTCEWLFPNGAVRATSTKYRVGELQRIMDASARNASNVVSYKEWLRKEAEKPASQSAEPTE